MLNKDNLQSPPEVLLPLLPHINPEWIVWEPTAGEGYLCKGLAQANIISIGTDILTGVDFLTTDIDFPYDAIVLNPPYSLKNEFLQRCFDLGKPFAMLLPIRALDSKVRHRLFTKYGIQLLILPEPVAFLDIPSGKRVRVAVEWFCWNLLPHQLMFS